MIRGARRQSGDGLNMATSLRPNHRDGRAEASGTPSQAMRTRGDLDKPAFRTNTRPGQNGTRTGFADSVPRLMMNLTIDHTGHLVIRMTGCAESEVARHGESKSMPRMKSMVSITETMTWISFPLVVD